MSACDTAIKRTKNLEVPNMSETWQYILTGILQFPFVGIPTIIWGFMNDEVADILIGCCQTFIPFIGWIWAWIWGGIMVYKGCMQK